VPRTLQRALFVVIPGLALWFLPIAGLAPQPRHLLAVFVATIIALVAHPVPMGVSAITAMTLLALTRTLPPVRVLSGFANLTVWLVFSAFLFARAITITRLGRRIAYLIIRRFGRSSLSLGYSLAVADLVLAPFVPSDTARGGGIMAPIVRSVAEAEGSLPGPTAAKLGSFLMLVGFHSTYTASAMFLTGMAANPLIADFAQKIAHVDLTWVRWASGAIVPGLLAIALVPLLIYKLVPPAETEAATARAGADRALAELGPVARREWTLLLVMLGVMAGWITSPLHGLHNTVVALAGVSTLLLSRVITWDDLLSEGRAWDALIWFAPLLMMADALTEAGVIGVLSQTLFARVTGLSWGIGLPVLLLSYLYLHYGFASMTAHVTALYPGFVAAALLTGAPPFVAAMALGYFSSIDASLTHYGTGSAPVYFGAGYVTQGTWWRVGFLVSLVQITLWLGVGMLWWKVLGWW
jgi:divalent anion:Na+ symporter, DASS family